MIGTLSQEMYRLAKIFANKSNGKTGISIMDDKIVLPSQIGNAGLWIGFVVGFRMCYKIMQDIRVSEMPAVQPTMFSGENEEYSG